MTDLLKLNFDKYCVHCNFLQCICPQKNNLKKIISAIKQLNVKNKKWVTNIYGNIEKSTFIYLKKYLGTGGTYEDKCVSLRGKIKNRVKQVLLNLSYDFAS